MVCRVIEGGVETGVGILRIAFDHLFFTGSTAVGRHVAAAAARNLTPVTLELGGKSPTIIDSSIGDGMEKAALSIMSGKLFNGGQSCIAPDYILTPHEKLAETVEALKQATATLYPDIASTPDYTNIISEKQAQRLSSLKEEAKSRNVTIHNLGPEDQHPRVSLCRPC